MRAWMEGFLVLASRWRANSLSLGGPNIMALSALYSLYKASRVGLTQVSSLHLTQLDHHRH